MPPETSTPSRFIVGIDLGTTNSAVAWVDTLDRNPSPRILPILQYVAVGEMEERETLPSFHYAPTPDEAESLRLPWHTERPGHAVGFFARDHGASAPGRLVVSAKSWMSHSGVDRAAELLPWHGAAEVEKLSPTAASARYLRHVRDVWNARWPDFPLEQQDVVITIPASFDEIARELTVSAAQKAGLPRIFLLEEPQAAFYAWIKASGTDWQRIVRPGQRILVCDIGGGTTDFTLIEVRPDERDAVRFHRYAVGEHLILGGDNLDVALAHHVEARISPGRKLEPRQWGVLVRKCQQVKEALLGPKSPERMTVNLPTGGSRLIGGSMSVEVSREEVLNLLVEGFLPFVGLEEKPARRASGFQEFGLPFAPDPAITKYLAAFLTAHRTSAATEDGAEVTARPDVILFNGGLFESPVMRERLLAVIRSWFPPQPGEAAWEPMVLKNERLDLAVAIGAACYGLVRRGVGVRISGGLAHSYYIGVQAGEGMKALCLAPAGLEEEQEVRVERRFDLLIRQPVEFPLFVSSSRTTDGAGDLVEIDPTQLSALPPVRTVLRTGPKEQADSLPVQLHVRLTPIGTLEVWCAEVGGGRKWKLQFDVRSATRTEMEAHEATGEQQGFLEQATVARCQELVRRTFAPLDAQGALSPERLAAALEETLELRRNEWPSSFLRALWEGLLEVEPGRARGAMHEARWLNLLGFALRPGFGVALDDWRVAQTWQIFARKVTHPGNEMCRAEWWILWRRIAGGLVAGQQRVLAEPLWAALKAKARGEIGTGKGGKAGRMAEFRFGPHESEEVWRLLGSLELLAAGLKVEMGQALLAEARRKAEGGGVALWTLGRLGARVPLHAPLNSVLPAEAVEPWIEALLTLGAGANFALIQLSRRSGDRYRDISDGLRARVLEVLRRQGASQHEIELVERGGNLAAEERSKVFGEALPAGLRLAGET